MDKATALCDWKRMLRAWRAWRAVVWEEKKRQEVARTEKELQKENRQEAKRNDIYKDPVYSLSKLSFVTNVLCRDDLCPDRAVIGS